MMTALRPSAFASLDTSPPSSWGRGSGGGGVFPRPYEVGERWFAKQTGEGENGSMSGSESRSRRTPGVTKRARNFRVTGNQAESLLWTDVKARRLNGFKFVRQFPVGPYFADFLCREARLVVELDGSQHADSAHDAKRDAFLNAEGYDVLRFWSVDMLRDRESVLATIVDALEGRLAENIEAFDLTFRCAFSRRLADEK
ncbi:MAG: DUF559 domain-containing protein [Oricola sp.]